MSKHSHYHKDVSRLSSIDVYRVCDLFAVTDPCVQHAVKKLLCAGVRGAKPMATDIQEAIDTLERWKEMRAEDAIGSMGIPMDFGQQHTIEPASAMDDDSERMQAIGQSGELGEEIYPAIDLAELLKRAPEGAAYYIASVPAWYKQTFMGWFFAVDDGRPLKWLPSTGPIRTDPSLIKL